MTTTFVAGLRIGGLSAPMIPDGHMDEGAFLASVLIHAAEAALEHAEALH